jgi:hypothetical protein
MKFFGSISKSLDDKNDVSEIIQKSKESPVIKKEKIFEPKKEIQKEIKEKKIEEINIVHEDSFDQSSTVLTNEIYLSNEFLNKIENRNFLLTEKIKENFERIETKINKIFVLVLNGSFNPITKIHKEILETCKKYLESTGLVFG